MFGASGVTLAALCQKLRIMALCREAYTLDNTVDDAVTQNTCHVGKSRTPNLDMRNRYTGKCRLTAGAFYPELAIQGNPRFVARVVAVNVPAGYG
jgi:hypothetical protein